MSRSLPSLGFKCLTLVVLLCSSLIFVERLSAQAPTPTPAPPEQPAKTDTAAQPAQPPAPADTQEVSSRDTPATFKVRVNLVLVRVVVRDAQGKVVPNLKKEDFQLYDGKKLQNISSFAVETPQSHTVSASASGETGYSSSADSIAGKTVVLPQRFVAMIFDDIHFSMQDVAFVRNAATKFFSSMAPSDRLAISTTSGQLTQEFSSDQEVLRKALLGIVPRPLTNHSPSDCPDMSYYQADLIVNKSDAQALEVATEETVQCAFNGDPTMHEAARTQAQMAAATTLGQGDSETDYTYRHLEAAVRRMVNLPGQRIIVLVSPGFILTTLQSETSDLVDRATRANIVINTIDARGLYTPEAGDIANPSRDTVQTAGIKSSYRLMSQSAQNEALAQFADGTGGTFYHNRNDVDEAMREAGAAPDVSYLLGFAPQNLKIDGRYHALKVTLASKQRFSIQARRGYYAPRSIADPAEAAKQEIQEALFSQEEIRDLSVDFQTQFFKKEQADARLAVLTHLDVRGIRFRKALGRNNDQLTIVTGIFDENGQYVTGGEKIIEMKLRDTTYDRLSRSGFVVKSSFDVKPGTYLVRLVVRDAEGAQMAARNGAVVIPY